MLVLRKPGNYGSLYELTTNTKVIGQKSVVKGQWSRVMIRGHCQRSRVTGHWSEVMGQSQGSLVKGQM